MFEKWWTLDENGEAVQTTDYNKHLELWQHPERRRVALTEIGEAKISTVFLAIDHNWGDGPPILWETMIFWHNHDLDGFQERYASREAAVRGHGEAVEKVKKAQEGQ